MKPKQRRLHGPIEYRFSRKFVKRGPNECWPWIGSFSFKGYGTLSIKRKATAAHRLAYTFAKGDPGEMHVLHKCDNRACVNPAHLFLGTNLDNMLDRDSKGRVAHGETHTRAKISDRQVLEIRRSNKSIRFLAEKYGLSPSYVGRLIKGTVRRRTISTYVRGRYLNEQVN